jgi:predicted dehydrogenase
MSRAADGSIAFHRTDGGEFDLKQRSAWVSGRLRVGLVGTGWMGKVHSMSFRTAQLAFGPEPLEPSLEIVASSTWARAERVAREWGYRRATDDWRRVVEDPEVDVVDVCTANDSHFDIAMAAIAAGKHVYCEKPLATNADHARQMADAARKKGLITLVGFNYIQNPVHALALSTLRNGDIGEVKHARVFFKSDYMADPDMPHSWRNEIGRAGAGVIGDVGSHCLSYYFHLIGEKIDEVFCNLETVVHDRPLGNADGAIRYDARNRDARRVPNTTDDIGTAVFKFAGGAGLIEANRVSPGAHFDIGYEIIGTRGMLRYSYDNINDLYIYRGEGAEEFRGFKRIASGPSNPLYAALLPAAGLALGYNDFKALEARELIVAIAENRPAHPDFDFGYQVQRVVEACQRSHDQRRWVWVSDVDTSLAPAASPIAT